MKFDSIIHIGCEKTGSTALQTALSVIGNDKLRLHGFKYIRPRLPEYSETDSSLAAIISLLRPDRLKYYLPTNTWSSPIDQVTQESEILLRRELKTASLENAAPILSSELFSSRFDTEEIERLKELMTSMDFHKPLILCYFRDPIETACSWISTRVKYGEWIDGCKLEYVAHEDLGLILGYNDVIRRWSSVFSDSSFFSFSYDSQNGNIIEHFCSACIGSIFGCTDWPALRDELVRHLRRKSLDAKNKKLNLVNMYIINHLNSFFSCI